MLGVDPGCRYVGTAVLEADELIHHAVDDIAEDGESATIRRAERAVGRLIDAYSPEVLVVERAFFSRGAQAPLLRRVTDAVTAMGVRAGLETISVAPSSLKKHTTGRGHASKADMARALTQHYPQLRLYMGASRKWQARVHSNRFDAIALARMGASGGEAPVPGRHVQAAPRMTRAP